MTTPTASSRIGALIGNAASYSWWPLAGDVADDLSGILPGPITVATSLFGLLQEKAFLFDVLASALRVVGSLAAAMLIGGTAGVAAVLVSEPERHRSQRHQAVPQFVPGHRLGAAGLDLVRSLELHRGVRADRDTDPVLPGKHFGRCSAARSRSSGDGAQLYSRSNRIFTSITIPLLLPYIVSALRSAYGVAWKIAIVAELFGAQSGLGFAMLRAEK